MMGSGRPQCGQNDCDSIDNKFEWEFPCICCTQNPDRYEIENYYKPKKETK